ncbi:hypothetical protein KY495_19050 [Massilia sp. PAMC28688]|uniref:hypothetical protein n=1 Tax=Massilia sp. PAMC28688 TaxID=2861283 RepID=UPI001C625A41|nr:hypothetical protein [Massilia sp. PAMC28688]QYF92799.1 hypothetical protein KY495_19050 [Massilia sp. PAMC28688]
MEQAHDSNKGLQKVAWRGEPAPFRNGTKVMVRVSGSLPARTHCHALACLWQGNSRHQLEDDLGHMKQLAKWLRHPPSRPGQAVRHTFPH